ncbi:MAG: OmpH family outer membrane protein [Rickettsiaceae bacterium]
MNFFKICILLILITFSKIGSADDCYIAKIAVVDIESVLENSLAITAIKKSINTLSQNIQDDISKQEKKLKIDEQKLLELQKTLSEEKFDSLVVKFNKDVSNTKKNMQLRKSALDQAYLEAIEEVHQKIIAIITELTKEHRLNMVLPSSQVLYVASELNVTFEVISKLNDSLNEVPINYQKFLKNKE